uniref:Uncharacterized protein n=1 Tax=Pararge aegeria TaxID=116150 RepID=S4PTC3_9NEOP
MFFVRCVKDFSNMLSIKRKNILSWYSLVDELPDLCFVVLPFGTKCKGWNSQATCAPVRRQGCRLNLFSYYQ